MYGNDHKHGLHEVINPSQLRRLPFTQQDMVVSLCPVHPRNRTVVRNTFETFEDTLQPIYNIIQPTPFGAYYRVYWVYQLFIIILYYDMGIFISIPFISLAYMMLTGSIPQLRLEPIRI